MIDVEKFTPLGAVPLFYLLGAIFGHLWGSGLARVAKELLLSLRATGSQSKGSCRASSAWLLFGCPGAKVGATDREMNAVGSSSSGQIVLGSIKKQEQQVVEKKPGRSFLPRFLPLPLLELPS